MAPTPVNLLHFALISN